VEKSSVGAGKGVRNHQRALFGGRRRGSKNRKKKIPAIAEIVKKSSWRDGGWVGEKKEMKGLKEKELKGMMSFFA